MMQHDASHQHQVFISYMQFVFIRKNCNFSK